MAELRGNESWCSVHYSGRYFVFVTGHGGMDLLQFMR